MPMNQFPLFSVERLLP